MYRHYLTVAARILLRNRFQTLLTVVGLAVAFFCFGICVYFVRGYLTMDHYYENHDRVVSLGVTVFDNATPSPKALEELKRTFPDVEATIAMHRVNAVYEVEEGREMNMRLMECDTTLRLVFNPRLIAGSWEAAVHSDNSLLMTEKTARKLFGSAIKAIGQQIKPTESKRCKEPQLYTIHAVVEDLAYNNTLMPFTHLDGWIMNDLDGSLSENSPAFVSQSIITRALLKEGTDTEEWIRQLNDAEILLEDMPSLDAEPTHIFMKARPTKSFLPDDSIQSYWEIVRICMISIPGLLILLSALSNFFQLLMSSILMRRREYTLRKAHGASTLNLWLMVSTQVIAILLLEGLCTMVVTELCAPLVHIDIRSLDSSELLRQESWELAGLLLIGLLVAWIAVSRVRKESLQESLKSSTGGRPGRHIGRNILIGWQMVVGFFFLTLLSALTQQIEHNEKVMYPHLSDQEKEEIITLSNNSNGFTSFAVLLRKDDEVKKIPSVKTFSTLNSFYLTTLGMGTYSIRNEEEEMCYMIYLDSTYLEMTNNQILEGRWMERPDDVLITASLAKEKQLRVGEQILLTNPHWYNLKEPELSMVPEVLTICGIINNIQEESTPNISFYHNLADLYLGIHSIDSIEERATSMVFQSMPGQVEEMKEALSKLYDLNENWQKSTPWTSLGDEIRLQNKRDRSYLGIFWLFAIIALVITVLGVFSAIMVDTSLRRKEMAIRKINGAKPWHIALRFARLYMILLVTSAAIAFPLTYLLFDQLSSTYRSTIAYGFSFYTPIFLFMLLLVAATVGVQIWQISRIEPAKVIKSE